MICCEVCNCPLTLLRNAAGRKERRELCERCREEQSMQSQVEMLTEMAEQLPPEPEKTLAPVLRIDQYLAERALKKSKKGSLLM